ncbi:MAG TPA: TetR/AcrR family transcriptional regulator [Nocardioides sp.]|nr:TetR/AcrR family transcriptional regulator [Nocardioides sp.]
MIQERAAAEPRRLSTLAVERALDKRAKDATAEVEHILDAALRVIRSAEPASPRVADIIAEAGSSTHAFYRYFGGKDDVILAVMDRGITILRSYIDHQVGKETDPPGRARRWVTAVLAQADDPELARESRAVGRLVATIRPHRVADADSFRATLVAPLVDALRDAGVPGPETAADAAYDVAYGALSRHVEDLTPIRPAERERLVEFCLKGAGLT